MTNEGKPDLSRATTLSLNNRLEETLGKTIQVSRIGRATDPKPKDKIWFTTQLQDLFVLDTTAATQSLLTQIESDLLAILDGNRIDREATRKHMESKGATDDQILNMEIEADDLDDTIDGIFKVIINYCRGSKNDGTE